MRLEGFGKWIQFIHLIGFGSRDLPVCHTVPQPVYCRVSHHNKNNNKNNIV
jgi:hypothetical protein